MPRAVKVLWLMFLRATAESLLHIGAKQGDVAKLADLLDNKGFLPWINQREQSEGKTPVFSASFAGHPDVVELLIQRGCNVSIPNDGGYTPMDAAAFQGHASVVAVLLKYSLDPYDFHTAHKDGYMPLHRACSGNTSAHAEVVQTLVESGIDAALQTTDGRSCLELASHDDTRTFMHQHLKSRQAAHNEL